MQPQTVLNTSFGIGLIEILILALVVIGIVAAIRHGYGKVVLGVGGVGLVGLLLLGFVGTSVKVQSSPAASDHMMSQSIQSPPQVTLLSNGHLLGAISIGLMAVIGGYLIRHGHWKALAIGGSSLVVLAAIVLPSVQQVREGERRAQQVNDLKQLGHRLHERHDSAMAPTAAPESPPPGPTPSQILYTTGNAQTIPIQELPGWRKNPPHEGTLGAGRAKYVLTSQQFATVEEAEAELFKSLTVDVQESFARYYSPAVGWTPTPEDLRLSGIIAERVVETFSVKVGEFENPVHRVSWLIEFDRDKSTVLLKRWEPIEAQRRSKLILLILAGASGVLGVTAMALRRRRPQPEPTPVPASGAA